MPEAEVKTILKQNGIKRPEPGSVTGMLWDIADKISADTGAPAARKAVVDAYMAQVPNANQATANTQYARWVTYHGASDVLRQARADETAARRAAKEQEREAAKIAKEQAKEAKIAELAAAKEAKEKEREAKKAAIEAERAEKKAEREAAAKAKAEAKAQEAAEKAEAKAKAKAEAEAAKAKDQPAAA